MIKKGKGGGNTITGLNFEKEKDILSILKKAKNYSKHLIFVGEMPVDEDKVDPIPWDKDFSYKNEFVKEYSKITKKLCEKYGVYYTDIYNRFIDKDYKALLQDGCHPNTKGHEIIFEIVKDFLIAKKII